MRWSLLVGRFWGTEIRLHASLLLLIPYGLIVFRPGNLTGALGVLLLIAAIFVCVALHEIGHTIAARLFGIQVSSIVLWPLGGFANLSHRPEKVLPDLLISAAGPLANLLVFMFLAVVTTAAYLIQISTTVPGLSLLFDRLNIFPFLLSLSVANLALAVFNMIPVYPLDGGQIARGVLKTIFGEKRADLILLLLSVPLALALVVAGVVSGDPIIILTGALLVLGGLSLNTRLLNGLVMGGLYFLDRGGYYLKRSDFDPALVAYTRAIQRSPDRAGLYVSRAVVSMNLLDVENALADVEWALTLDSNHYLAWTLRGELLALDQKRKQALMCFNRAIELRPNWPTVYVDRGQLYEEMGDTDRALRDLNHAVEIGRGSPVAHLIRSMLRYKTGDLRGSREDAEQILRYAPEYMLVFPEVFLINLAGYLDWCMAYYSLAIERMPRAYQAYQGRADAARVNRRPAWAVEDYTRAIWLAPRQAELYLNRGHAYRMLAMPEQAAADFRQALRLANKSHLRRQAQAHLNAIVAGRVRTLSTPAASTGNAARGEPAAPIKEAG